MIWLQLAVVLLCLYLGARYGGAGLGIMGGLGLGILVFGFKLQATAPPIDVMLIILAVVTVAASLQAAGGLEYLVRLAEKMLRRNPRYITFLGPVVTYLFTFCSGTGHVAYSVLPVIAEVSWQTKIRPERPMTVSCLASQFAITASPISAAMAAMLTLTGDQGMTLPKLMGIVVPATFLAIMVTALIMNFWGKELDQDPEFQRRLETGEFNGAVAARAQAEPEELPPRAGLSVVLFLLGAFTVVLLGAVPELRPAWMVNEKLVRLGMPDAIQIVMLCTAALIVICCRPEVGKIVRGSVFAAGAQALIGIFGIAWLGDTWFRGNAAFLQGGLTEVVTATPWLFAVGLYIMAMLLYSQAATVRALMPLGLTLGLPAPALAAMMPAVNGGLFVLPNYGTVIAAIAFDRTGTTRIGRWVINHSFMIPSVIATIFSVLFGFLFQSLVW